MLGRVEIHLVAGVREVFEELWVSDPPTLLGAILTVGVVGSQDQVNALSVGFNAEAL